MYLRKVKENRRDIKAWADYIAASNKILLIPHDRSDGDAVGSVCALKLWLDKIGKDSRIIFPSEISDFLKFVPASDKAWEGHMNHQEIEDFAKEADLQIHADFSHDHRMGDVQRLLPKDLKKIVIDHHLHPAEDYLAYYWDPRASSTCELVYDLICESGDEALIDSEIATAIYTGILTDTGSFRYTNTTPHVHKIVAGLIERGADFGMINSQIYEQFEADRIKLFGHCLLNNLTLDFEKGYSYMTLSNEEKQQFGVKTGWTEGLVNYGISIKGINLTALISEHNHETRFSIRSRGEVPANKLASEHFGGGGHFYAAGGRLKCQIDEARAKFVTIVDEFMNDYND